MKHTELPWKWGEDWECLDNGKDDKYMDLRLHCGDEVVIPLRVDHYAFEFDGNTIAKDKREYIVKSCNAYPKLVDKLIKIHDMLLSIHVCDSDATRLSMERFSISDLLKELGETE